MKRKIPKWQKGLTKKERDHIKTWCGGTLKGLKANREHQKAKLKKNPDIEPCWDCRMIARKVGIE